MSNKIYLCVCVCVSECMKIWSHLRVSNSKRIMYSWNKRTIDGKAITLFIKNTIIPALIVTLSCFILPSFPSRFFFGIARFLVCLIHSCFFFHSFCALIAVTFFVVTFQAACIKWILSGYFFIPFFFAPVFISFHSLSLSLSRSSSSISFTYNLNICRGYGEMDATWFCFGFAKCFALFPPYGRVTTKKKQQRRIDLFRARGPNAMHDWTKEKTMFMVEFMRDLQQSLIEVEKI